MRYVPNCRLCDRYAPFAAKSVINFGRQIGGLVSESSFLWAFKTHQNPPRPKKTQQSPTKPHKANKTQQTQQNQKNTQ